MRIFPEKFWEDAEANPLPPGHPVVADLIEKDAPRVAEIERRQLENLMNGCIDGSIDLTSRPFEQYMSDLEARVAGRDGS